VATGFAPGDQDKDGFNLRAMDKHAWVEVYFPGDRWQIFDPTVGTRTDGSIPVRRPPTAGFWQHAWHTLGANGPLPKVLITVIVLLLVYVAKVEVWDRWRRLERRVNDPKLPPRTLLEQQYTLMTQTLGRLGLPRRPSETPAEYEARALPFLQAQEATLGVPLSPGTVSAVTTQFVTARYGGGRGQIDTSVGAALAEFLRSAAQARRVQFWHRLRHR
jgi:hypothetical protein